MPRGHFCFQLPIEVGKYADLVVLSADPRSVPPEQIAGLDVRATFLAGRRVYAKV